MNEIVNKALFTISGTAVTISTVIAVFCIIMTTLLVRHIVSRAIERTFSHIGTMRDGALRSVQKLIGYGIFLLGLLVALSTLGVDISALFAAGAFFAVAIGFAMQNITQNFVSGVILLVERAITPGDVIELDGQVLRVQSMGIRSTIARTFDEDEVIIPNSNIVQVAVKNRTLSDTIARVKTSVSVGYDSDLNHVRDTLMTCAKSFPFRRQDRDPVIVLNELGDSALVFDIAIWTSMPGERYIHRGELNVQIIDSLRSAGIEIPFPQRVIHNVNTMSE